MSTPILHDLSQEQIDAAMKEGGTKRGAARLLGIGESSLRAVIGRLAREEMFVLPAKMVVKRHSVTLDHAEELKSQSLQMVTAPGTVWEMPSGHIVKGVSALLDPEGRLLAKWVKTREGESALLHDALLAAFESHTARSHSIIRPDSSESNTLTVYPLPDLHFGMYSWDQETGDNYDIRIARKVAVAAVTELVAQSRPSKRAVLLGLGDYFHMNDQRNVTPRSGHRLDVDTRWSQVYAAGAELLLVLVELLLTRHDIVDVVALPGNHDEDAAVTLRVALSLYFRNNKRVRVYDLPGLAWYYRFGATLIGAHHGHTMKHERMALMMATDRAKDWGDTTFRHFLFGHIHHESAKEVGPVRVESFQTPAARDAFAQDGGYRSGRSLSAITFHAKRGEIGRHRVNIIRS